MFFKTLPKRTRNSYLCNEIGKVTFFRTRCGIFNRDVVEIKNAETRRVRKKTLFLRVAHITFSNEVEKTLTS
jgi:hypothetical protein